MNVFRVLDPGLLATFQDAGRPGHRADGVAPGGAFDRFAAAAANLLVGNPEGTAVLEITYRGPSLALLAPCVVAVTGADLGAAAAGRPVPGWRPVELPSGTTLAFGARVAGCRAYLAVAGGFEAPAFLGSRSADLRGGFGPARLAKGDVLAVGAPGRLRGADFAARAAAVYRPAGELRVVPGPDAEWFGDAALAALCSAPYRVHSASDRAGVRLTGPAVPRAPGEMLSRPVGPGHVQVPPDGQPIVLGPECGSVGGYPRVACLIAADLPRLAQALPHDEVRFVPADLDEARWLLAGQRALLEELRH